MTTIIYNGIRIVNVLTEDISQEAEYEETGVDPIGVRVRASFRGIVHTNQNQNAISIGVSEGGDLAASMRYIQGLLTTPRRRFQMTVGGSTLFNIVPGAVEIGSNITTTDSLSNMEIDNGPKPKLEIFKIVGSHSMHIRFQIEFLVANCNKTVSIDPNGSGRGMISFRFWIEDDWDENFYCTRTFRGRLRVANKRMSPLAFARLFAMPPLAAGFKREAIHTREAPNGLECEFEIVDRQQHAMPLYPATTWGGTFQITSPFAGGQVSEAEVRVWLEGPPHVPKRLLHQRAQQVIESKLHTAEQTRKKSGQQLFLYGMVMEDLAKNRVEAVARVKLVGDEKLLNMAGAGKDLGTFIKAPNYAPKIAVTPAFGNGAASIIISAMRTPCTPFQLFEYRSRRQRRRNEEQHTEGEEERGTAVTTAVGPLEDDSQIQGVYSKSHETNLYTDYILASEINTEEGKAFLPIADSSDEDDEDSIVEISLHRPVTIREVRIEAERLNVWPELPEAKSYTDENKIVHKLKSFKTIPHAPVTSADGRKTLHRVDAVIIYVLSRKPTDKDSLPAGRLPYRKGRDEKIANLTPDSFIKAGSQDSIV